MSQPFPLPREIRQTDVLSGDGGATYGPFAFRIFDEADVRAYVRPAGGGFFERAEISVTKVEGAPFDLFSVTFDTPVPADSSFVVQAARLHERQIAITRGGAIAGIEMEKELSKQGSVLDELRRDMDRTLQLDFGQDGGRVESVPAGHFWQSDGDGNFVDGGSADDIANAQENAEIASEAAGVATGAAAASIAARNAARDWASKEEDAPVDDGVHAPGFSAFHWAKKAEDFATGAAVNISVQPAGDITETNVQAALEELDAKKVKVAGDQMTGRLVTAASTTGEAGINVAPGVAPAAPVNGDLWSTAAGLFARIAGATWNLLAANVTAVLTAGFRNDPHAYGNLSGATIALSVNNGHAGTISVNGAGTIDAPTEAGTYDMKIQLTGVTGAGTITWGAGFTDVFGDDDPIDGEVAQLTVSKTPGACFGYLVTD
jgi:hypothetical protein